MAHGELKAPANISPKTRVATIVIQLDPAQLPNPDTDIRYVLPRLLVERLPGALVEDGYDYVVNGTTAHLQLFLTAPDADAGIRGIIRVLTRERVLNNDLSQVPIAIDDGKTFRVIHPPDFRGNFQYAGDGDGP